MKITLTTSFAVAWDLQVVADIEMHGICEDGKDEFGTSCSGSQMPLKCQMFSVTLRPCRS